MAQLRREDISEIVLRRTSNGYFGVLVWPSNECQDSDAVDALDRVSPAFPDYAEAEAYAWQLAARFGMEVTVR